MLAYFISVHEQGVNKDSYLILEKLPTEYDSRVKAMELDERPTEQYSDIGGLDTQIQEVSKSHQVSILEFSRQAANFANGLMNFVTNSPCGDE